MKNIITAALWGGILVQLIAQILLWDRVKKLEEEEKSGESPAIPEAASWEKLWARGLEGIMSYSVADARGERQDDQ